MREGRDVCLDAAVARAREALHLPVSEKKSAAMESSKN